MQSGLDPSVLDDLYDGTLDSALWSRGILKVADSIGATCASLLAFDPTQGLLLRDEGYRVGPELLTTYRRWVAEGLEPRTALLQPKAAMELCTTGQLLPLSEWHRTQIFNEFLKPIDCAYLLGGWLHKSPSCMTALTFQGSTRRGDFDASDSTKLQPLLPHIQRALTIRDRLEQHALRADTLAACMEHSAIGILILDHKSRVLEGNTQAYSMLRGQPGIAIAGDGHLQLRNPASTELRHWLTYGRPADTNRSGVIHVARAGQRPLSLLLNALPRAQTSWTGAQARWLLFMFDPEATLHPSIALLASDMGLSEREAEITALMASGLQIPDLAQRLGISVHTARVHLKSIFSKVGVHSQVELVRRVLQGPAGSLIRR